MTKTPTRQLLDAALKEAKAPPFEDLVEAARAEDQSWRWIEREIARITGMWITSNTLRLWAQADQEPVAS